MGKRPRVLNDENNTELNRVPEEPEANLTEGIRSGHLKNKLEKKSRKFNWRGKYLEWRKKRWELNLISRWRASKQTCIREEGHGSQMELMKAEVKLPAIRKRLRSSGRAEVLTWPCQGFSFSSC